MGCGSHIPSVLDAVPESQWCSCGPQVERGGKLYPPGGTCSYLPEIVILSIEGIKFADCASLC